jgi:hypothetical protein
LILGLGVPTSWTGLGFEPSVAARIGTEGGTEECPGSPVDFEAVTSKSFLALALGSTQ